MSEKGMADEDVILQVEDLSTQFRLKNRTLKAVDGLSFSLRAGRTLCIVGESGSGKTVTSLSLLRLIDPPGRIVSGRLLYRGRDLLQLSEAEMEAVRGDRIAMVFQDPMSSLNPSFRVGDQIAEGLTAHKGLGKEAARRQAIDLMRRVGIPQPEARYRDYPHQFSGGMRQRVLIAGAIACEPDLLIADEPTTALDVTIQAQILRLLRAVQTETGSTLLLVTHDLGVVAAMADEVMVMYAGKMVEYGDVKTIFAEPGHPYTRGLLSSLVRLDEERDNGLQPIPGLPPDLAALPGGCSFWPRCPLAEDRCREHTPALREGRAGHKVACHLFQPAETSA
ncbi:MAG: ABC transporter ATP-binding protein [Rhodospirillales bacterium]